MAPVTVDLLQALLVELRKSGALNKAAIGRVADVVECRSLTAADPQVAKGLHTLAEHFRRAGEA